MAEYVERTAANADDHGDVNKIKTHFAQIIVRSISEKPYYEILYFDTEDRSYHIGFGSYCLDYVFEWLSECFEIVESEQEALVTEEYVCMNNREILENALTTFGAEAQILMVMEEMAELQKELCKNLRGKANVANIAEEIADVQIMLDQMTLLYDCEHAVEANREYKLMRLESRIEAVLKSIRKDGDST